MTRQIERGSKGKAILIALARLQSNYENEAKEGYLVSERIAFIYDSEHE